MSKTIPSPCIQHCQMDRTTGYCAGCLRTLEEIAAWSRLDNAHKSTILSKLSERRQRLHAFGSPK